MNMRITKIIISVGLFVMLMGTAVQAQDYNVDAKIPFSFFVSNVLMPVGEYDVTKLNIGNGVFRIRDSEAKNAVAQLVMPVSRQKAPTETMLIFNRYQENGGEVSYFLSQIWFEGVNTGYEFLKYRLERETAKRAANRDIIAVVIPTVKNRAD
ncbi:MAG TPA: hypothetical protein VFZ34_08790 [Blastocatellia bacterium]|nr:hypothetical protein [Blastocatellia bacterium]